MYYAQKETIKGMATFVFSKYKHVFPSTDAAYCKQETFTMHISPNYVQKDSIEA